METLQAVAGFLNAPLLLAAAAVFWRAAKTLTRVEAMLEFHHWRLEQIEKELKK